ncbi:MAG: Bax inhibitor-1/YccA family protein [Spirochaetota bacterium]
MSNFRTVDKYNDLNDPNLINDIATAPISEEFERKFISKTYLYMVLALVITAAVGYFTASTGLILSLFRSSLIFFGLIIAEFVVVFWLSSQILKLSTGMALFGFLLYSIINGLTLSAIFLVYTQASIVTAFLITAGMFLVMSLVGFTTKTNLMGFGGYLMTALFGIIIASIVNIFLKSSTLYWIISAGGVLIFTILIAYSTQKLKIIAKIASFEQGSARFAILAALELYLNFINLLLYVLRFLGKRR